MKAAKLRRSVDLSRNTIIVLQWQAVAAGYGTIKPYLEKYIEEHAARILQRNPSAKNLLLSKKR